MWVWELGERFAELANRFTELLGLFWESRGWFWELATVVLGIGDGGFGNHRGGVGTPTFGVQHGPLVLEVKKSAAQKKKCGGISGTSFYPVKDPKVRFLKNYWC